MTLLAVAGCIIVLLASAKFVGISFDDILERLASNAKLSYEALFANPLNVLDVTAEGIHEHAAKGKVDIEAVLSVESRTALPAQGRNIRHAQVTVKCSKIEDIQKGGIVLKDQSLSTRRGAKKEIRVNLVSSLMSAKSIAKDIEYIEVTLCCYVCFGMILYQRAYHCPVPNVLDQLEVRNSFHEDGPSHRRTEAGLQFYLPVRLDIINKLPSTLRGLRVSWTLNFEQEEQEHDELTSIHRFLEVDLDVAGNLRLMFKDIRLAGPDDLLRVSPQASLRLEWGAWSASRTVNFPDMKHVPKCLPHIFSGAWTDNRSPAIALVGMAGTGKSSSLNSLLAVMRADTRPAAANASVGPPRDLHGRSDRHTREARSCVIPVGDLSIVVVDTVGATDVIHVDEIEEQLRQFHVDVCIVMMPYTAIMNEIEVARQDAQQGGFEHDDSNLLWRLWGMERPPQCAPNPIIAAGRLDEGETKGRDLSQGQRAVISKYFGNYPETHICGVLPYFKGRRTFHQDMMLFKLLYTALRDAEVTRQEVARSLVADRDSDNQ